MREKQNSKDKENGKILRMKYKLKKISGDASFREFYRLKKTTKTQSLSRRKKKNLKISQYMQ